MKNRISLVLVFFIYFFASCGQNTQKNTTTDEQNSLETKKTQTTQQREVKTVGAKFQMMIANTAGTSYTFKTNTDEELQLFPDKNLTGMEFAKSLQPGNTDHEFFGKAFEIKYETRPFQTTGGDIVDRLYLLEVKEAILETKTTGIKLDDLKNIKFSGVEPAWTIKFTDKNVIFSLGYEPNPIEMVYYGDYDGSNQRIKQISENEVQVRFIHKSALDKGFINIAIIKKENCNDGMSENTYPYSIKVQQEESTLSGCGWIPKNTAKANDFEIFWKNIQKAVANNDKAAFMKMCSKDMLRFFESQKYEDFINEEMKKEVAKASVKEIEDRSETEKLFVYKHYYEGANTDYEAGYSTFGFWFKKIDGQWRIDQPQMGG